MNFIFDNDILNNLDLDFKNLIQDDYKIYYNNLAGVNEYRLYKYISDQLSDNIIILDIGTYYGTSAISLSHNETNMVYTYDIKDFGAKDRSKKNIIFLNKNFLEDKELISKSALIILDIKHNGKEEIEIYDKLKEYNFKGLLLLDDIHFGNREPLGGKIQGYNMNIFWNYIDLPKWDLTKYGHVTGTGLVDFNNNIKNITFN